VRHVGLHVEDVIFPGREVVEIRSGLDIGYQNFRADIMSLFGQSEADA
jgi:hypothetical protein